jgi:hypothetical protein
MPFTNGLLASVGVPTSVFARGPFTVCCSYEKYEEGTAAKYGGGAGVDAAGGAGAGGAAGAGGLAFTEKNARVDVGVPAACLRAWRGVGTRGVVSDGVVRFRAARWRMRGLSISTVRHIWERARAVTRRVAEETRTVDRRARRGATAANWVETRGAIWNDASLCEAED